MKKLLYTALGLFGIIGALSLEIANASDYVSTIPGLVVTGEQDGQVFEYGVLKFDDGSGHIITLLDRNLGATNSGTGCDYYTNGNTYCTQGDNTYGYYYQRGNNHGFPYTENVLSGYTKVEWDDSYENKGYFGETFIKGTIDYWSGNKHYNGLWGGSGDNKDNNWGLNTITVKNITNRQGPCPTGYHIPSGGEWINLVKYWAEVYSGEGNNLELDINSEGWLSFQDNIAARTKFQQDFKIPFAGSYDRNGYYKYLGLMTNFWLSSPPNHSYEYSYYGLTAYIHTNHISMLDNQYRSEGEPIRCFSNDYLFPKYSVVFYDGESEIRSGTVASGEIWTGNISGPDTKTGYNFEYRYLSGTDATTGFDFENEAITGGMANEEDVVYFIAKWSCTTGYKDNGGVCVINKDIVIEATSTAANQFLTVNKYFANTYTVDRGDGSPVETVSSDKTHRYSVASGYTITLSLSGADRWTFQRISKPLVPKTSTSMTGVKIIYMPSLEEGFGVSAAAPGDSFFCSFNYDGKLTSLPEGSFDTSKITTVENNFFQNFNSIGALTGLPAGSFDTSNVTGSVGDCFFDRFNSKGKLISLSSGSFDISKITTVGNNFFNSFNGEGQLTSLPEGSFDTSKITTVGDSFFFSFNARGSLTSLPGGSFDISKITTVGNSFFDNFNTNGALTSLPTGSFDTSKITTVGDSFFNSFNGNGQLTSLPTGSFDTSKITTVGNHFFQNFNNRGQLTSLPTGSFDTSNVVGSVGNYFFFSFNARGSLISLPTGSFDTSKITTVGNGFFSYFNENGKLTSLPGGSFDTSKITTVGNDFFYSFNSYGGQLTSLPEGSFDTSKITTVGNNFFNSFNGEGQLTSLPEGSFDTSKITTVGDGFFGGFNTYGAITILPDSFKLTSATYNKTSGYGNAFNSPDFTLNKKVSDLVSGMAVPLNDRNTFSDNQPGRCGVDVNWLVNPATACKTVIFETNSGTLVDSQIVDIDVNEKVVKPTDPTKTGYTFSGWYSDESLNEIFDFSTVVTGDTTLYAKWDINEYTLKLDVDGTLRVITGEYGSPIMRPSDPEKNGYRFIGWEPEIPSTMPAEDMTIYAEWERNGSSGGGGGGGGGGSTSKTDTGSTSSGTGNQINSNTGDISSTGTNIKEPETNTGSSIQTGSQVNSNTGSIVSSGTNVNNSDTDTPGDSTTPSQNDKIYSTEFQQAYEFAKGNGITTMPTIQKANMEGKLTRIAMAKMLSQYAINVLGKTPDATQNNKFNDVTDKLDSDYDDGVTLAYQLGIMGQNMPGNNFRPDDEVTRAEFATALSRMLYATSDGIYKSTSEYYTNHMKKLKEEGIITKDDPKMKELRGYVMIMLMRSAK